MKVKSKYFEQDFEANLVKKIEGKDIKYVPSTESMIDILYHQTPIEKRPTVDWNAIPATYPAFECIIVDMLGNRVVGYGSAPLESLVNDRDKKDPVKLARTRAFYEAMMFFYDFEIKIEKNAVTEELVTKKINVADENINGGETVIENISEDSGTIKMVEQSEEQPKIHEPTVKDNEDPGSVLISFGKYAQNPKTVAEVYEIEVVGHETEEKNWFYYMCRNMSAERYKDTLSAMKAYRAMKEKQGH